MTNLCTDHFGPVQCELLAGHKEPHFFSARAVIEAFQKLEDQIAALTVERDEARAGYDLLDKNWSALHESAMHQIRRALEMPDAAIPELVQRINALKQAASLDQELRKSEQLAREQDLITSEDP